MKELKRLPSQLIQKKLCLGAKNVHKELLKPHIYIKRIQNPKFDCLKVNI